MKIFEKYTFEEGVLEAMIEEYMTKQVRLGQVGEPESPIINIRNVSHEVTELTPTEFKYSILKTPMGEVLKKMKQPIVFRPYIMGVLNEKGEIQSGEIISINVF